jgi:hypothetical protein
MRMISSVPSRRCEIASERIVVGDDAARVADHVRVAVGETENAVWVEARVHAREHRDTLAGGSGRPPRSNSSAYRSAVWSSSPVMVTVASLPLRACPGALYKVKQYTNGHARAFPKGGCPRRSQLSAGGSVPSRYGPSRGTGNDAYASRAEVVSVATAAPCLRAASATG